MSTFLISFSFPPASPLPFYFRWSKDMSLPYLCPAFSELNRSIFTPYFVICFSFTCRVSKNEASVWRKSRVSIFVLVDEGWVLFRYSYTVRYAPLKSTFGTALLSSLRNACIKWDVEEKKKIRSVERRNKKINKLLKIIQEVKGTARLTFHNNIWKEEEKNQ